MSNADPTASVDAHGWDRHIREDWKALEGDLSDRGMHLERGGEAGRIRLYVTFNFNIEFVVARIITPFKIFLLFTHSWENWILLLFLLD